MGPTSQTRARRRRAGRALVLAIAAGWLLAAAFALAAGSTQSVAASPDTHSSQALASSNTPGAPNTPTSGPPTATSTSAAVASPTATSAASTPSATVTGTATDVATATATAAPPPVTTGGGSYQGGGTTGPQPTRVVFTQPTVGSDGGGPLQGLSSSAFASNGLLIATTLSCVAAVLGIIIAAVALSVLIRGGYGPFLKSLWRGRRGSRRGHGPRQPHGASHADVGWGDGTLDARMDGMRGGSRSGRGGGPGDMGMDGGLSARVPDGGRRAPDRVRSAPSSAGWSNREPRPGRNSAPNGW